MHDKYAAAHCKDTIDIAAQGTPVAKVDDLLLTDNEGLSHACRPMRRHLLRCVESQRSISYLRGLLKGPCAKPRWGKVEITYMTLIAKNGFV